MIQGDDYLVCKFRGVSASCFFGNYHVFAAS